MESVFQREKWGRVVVRVIIDAHGNLALIRSAILPFCLYMAVLHVQLADFASLYD